MKFLKSRPFCLPLSLIDGLLLLSEGIQLVGDTSLLLLSLLMLCDTVSSHAFRLCFTFLSFVMQMRW